MVLRVFKLPGDAKNTICSEHKCKHAQQKMTALVFGSVTDFMFGAERKRKLTKDRSTSLAF